MAGSRKEAEAFIVKHIDMILPGSENKAFYERLFKTMSDKAFDQLMNDIELGARNLVIYAPNFKDGYKLSTERNIEIAKKLGHNFFSRLWIGATEETSEYLTPIPYLVYDMPVRRASQTISSKIKVPENNAIVDRTTGQATSSSKASRISLPQLQILSAFNLKESVKEMIKFRGGDTSGFRAMNASISTFGHVSLKAIEPYSQGVESTKTLRVLLNGAHIKNTL